MLPESASPAPASPTPTVCSGYTQYTQLTNVHFVDQRLWMASGFVEDDWKVTPQLTLNLGLRYDFATPAMEGQNRMANFDPAGNGGNGSLVFAKGGSVENRALVHPNTKNFGPRIGFAYSPDTKTVIRGGYGIYYSLFERIGSEDELALNPPFLINKTIASNTAPVLTPSVGFPSNFLDPTTINFNSLHGVSHPLRRPTHDPTPNVQQWSLGFQRQIGSTWAAQVDYVGTKSTHLDVISQLQPAHHCRKRKHRCHSLSQLRADRIHLADRLWKLQRAAGQPHAPLHQRAQRAGLPSPTRAASTTLPRNWSPTPATRLTAATMRAWYGPSDFDIPNRVAVSYVYELPFGHGQRMLNSGPAAWILGNWRTSGVYTFYSGHPFQVNENDGNHNSMLDPYGYTTAMPNLVGKPHIVGDPDCWFYASKNCACSLLVPFRPPMPTPRPLSAPLAMSAAIRCADLASTSSTPHC